MKLLFYLLFLLYGFQALAYNKIMWQKFTNSTIMNIPSSGWKIIGNCIDQNGNIYIASIMNGGDTTSPIVSKYLPNGSLAWKKLLVPISVNNQFRYDLNGDLQFDTDGNLVFATCGTDTLGSAVNQKSKLFDLLVKINKDGDILNTKYNYSNNLIETIFFFDKMFLDTNGDIFLTYHNVNIPKKSEILINKYDSNFEKIWGINEDSILSNLSIKVDFCNITKKDSLLFCVMGSYYSGMNFWHMVCINANTSNVIWENYFAKNDLYCSVIDLKVMNNFLYIGTLRLIKVSIADGSVVKESTPNYSPFSFIFNENTNRIYTINIDPDPFNFNHVNFRKIVVYEGDSLQVVNEKTLSEDLIRSKIKSIQIKDSVMSALVIENVDDMNPDIKTARIFALDTGLNVKEMLEYKYPPIVQRFSYNDPSLFIDQQYKSIIINQLTVKHPGSNATSTPFIQKICFDCEDPNITGIVYQEVNNNCLLDSTDYKVANNFLKLMPLDILTTTDNNGQYYFYSDSNNVTIEAIPFLNNLTFCNNVSTINLNLSNGPVDSVNFGYNVINLPPKDIRTTIMAGLARPGFHQYISCNFYNDGLVPLYNTKVSVKIDTGFVYNSSTLIYDSIVGNVYYFTLDTLNINDNKYLNIDVIVNANLGDYYTHYATAYLIDDINMNNNSDTTTGVVIGSFDPNYIKVNPEGITIHHLIENGTELEYYIEFQNTGTDTAFNVKINFPVDDDLDLLSFKFTGSTHQCRTLIENKMITFVFDNILLVDSNKSYDASIGHLTFNIKPKVSKDGTKIVANAAIYFDFNKPVITNTVYNTIGRPGSIFIPDDVDDFNLFPNPSNSNKFKMVVNPISSNYQIAIMNLSGRKINFDNKSYKFNGKYYHSIELLDNAEGLYLIQMKTPKRTIVKKWIYATE